MKQFTMTVMLGFLYNQNLSFIHSQFKNLSTRIIILITFTETTFRGTWNMNSKTHSWCPHTSSPTWYPDSNTSIMRCHLFTTYLSEFTLDRERKTLPSSQWTSANVTWSRWRTTLPFRMLSRRLIKRRCLISPPVPWRTGVWLFTGI